MTNLKTELEDPKMKTVQGIISKAIEEKAELKIDENLETNLENFTIWDEDFFDYTNLVSDLLSFSQMTISKSPMNDYLSSLEKCDFTKEDFFYYLTLENQIWKVLDENVLDKEFVSDFHFCRLENDFDEFMTDNRKKVFEFKFDQTEVWKELEPRIEKGIGNIGYLEKVKNWNKSRKKKITELNNQKIEKEPYKEITVDKKFREIFGEVTPNPSVVKNLLLESGNRCAFPKCKKKLIESDGYLKGEICCMEYNAKNYSRFNPNITTQDMVESNNLILLCDVHHFEIEFKEDKFPPDILQKWKSNHESKNNEKMGVDDPIIEKFIEKFLNFSPFEKWGFYKKTKNKWSGLQGLISTFGITICSKCRTRTKMMKTEPGPHDGWIGYTICPKCGFRERWLSEFSFPSAG